MSPRKPATSVTEPILLLDLGSAWLRVAVVVDGRPHMIAFPSEGLGIPVAAGFDGAGMVFGDLARRLTLTQPREQITRMLRLAGLRHELAGLVGDRRGPGESDEPSEWRQVPVGRGRGADVVFELGDQRWPIPRLLGLLIQRAVEQVERQREITLEQVYVAIAPGSDDARRRMIVHALRIAGFDQIELIPSTTAAAIAWSKLEREGPVALGFASLDSVLRPSLDAEPEDQAELAELDAGEAPSDDEEPPTVEASTALEQPSSEPEQVEHDEVEDEPEPESPREQLVLVLDLGASSFDAALVRLDAGSVEVLAARSRCDLGGDQIDDRLVEWMLERFEADAEVDLSGDAVVRARMRDVAEKTKIALSDADSHELRLPYLWADPSGPKHLFAKLERARFERMIQDIVADVGALAQAVIRDAGEDPNELDAVVMVGGTSRIPVVQDRLEGLFGRVPETELGNPALTEDFVARGLALEAIRRGQRRPATQVVELASRDVWLEREGSEPRTIFERGTPLPARRTLELELELVDSAQAWGSAEAWIWDGDADDRSRGPALRVRLRGDRKQLALDVELDRNGELIVSLGGLGPKPGEATLRVDQRVGLSGRALRRFRLEAQVLATAAAERDQLDRLRRRVQELARVIETWLTDPKVNLDELVRTSLVTWHRDAEASLEHGDVALFTIAIESFLSLTEALPNKLKNQVDAVAIAAQIRGLTSEDQEGEEPAEVEDQPLGEPEDDYEGEEVERYSTGADDSDSDADEDEPDESDADPEGEVDVDNEVEPEPEPEPEAEPEPEPEPDDDADHPADESEPTAVDLDLAGIEAELAALEAEQLQLAVAAEAAREAAELAELEAELAALEASESE